MTPSQAILDCHKKYISASICDISTKFGLLIDFDLLKAVASTDTKPEVVFSRRGRHLEKWMTYFRGGCFDLDKFR